MNIKSHIQALVVSAKALQCQNGLELSKTGFVCTKTFYICGWLCCKLDIFVSIGTVSRNGSFNMYSRRKVGLFQNSLHANRCGEMSCLKYIDVKNIWLPLTACLLDIFLGKL